ncbi:MAG: ABC transporter ATP-binding protein [Alphaproteobacteria bacterium]|nr:ABC transporter ATP-binding protein [Alphaproteobacteria bacterium]
MLQLDNIHSGYGETQILHGVNLHIKQGEVHALLGRNGVGKSTTLKAIMGQLPLLQGDIAFDNKSLNAMKPYHIAKLGVAFVPETRDIFGQLTVRENLQMAGRLAGGNPTWTMQKIIELFPNLQDRMDNGGHQLSGGEQQMLAIGRALMTNPRILLLDEPTEGLAPIIIQQILQQLLLLKQQGLTILLVEQNLNFALTLADHVSLMSRGQIVWEGSNDALRNDKKLHQQWLGV